MLHGCDRPSPFPASGDAASLAAAGGVLASSTAIPAAAADARTPQPAEGVTRTLAAWVHRTSYAFLPANVRKEGVRTVLNYAGVAVGGLHHETVDNAVKALAPFSGPGQAALLGWHERFDIMNAAFANGVSSHIFDYDDTHLKTKLADLAEGILPAGQVRKLMALCWGMEQQGMRRRWRVLPCRLDCRLGAVNDSQGGCRLPAIPR